MVVRNYHNVGIGSCCCIYVLQN